MSVGCVRKYSRTFSPPSSQQREISHTRYGVGEKEQQMPESREIRLAEASADLELEEILYIFTRAFHECAQQKRVDDLQRINEYCQVLMEEESDEVDALPEAWAELADFSKIAAADCLDLEQTVDLPDVIDFASQVAQVGTMPRIMWFAYQDFDGSIYPNAAQIALEIMEVGN